MAKSLKLSPEATKKCTDACDALIDGLQDQLAIATRLNAVSGLGDIPSANQLREGFAGMAAGNEGALTERLQQFIEIAKQIRANFAAGGAGFEQMEQEFAEALKRTGGNLQ